MIIIVEGIDRVGKTTLANMISKECNYPLFKDNPKYNTIYTDKTINSEKINLLLNLMEINALQNIILDRGHFTEFVYGIVDRDYVNDDVWGFDERLAELDNVLLIYVKPEDIERSTREHGSDLSHHNQLMDECMNKSKIKNIIHTSYSQLNKTLEQVKELINR